MALISQIEHIELKGPQIMVRSSAELQVKRGEIPKTVHQKRRVYFDLKPAVLVSRAPKVLLSRDQSIALLRIGQHSKDTVRVVAEVNGDADVQLRVNGDFKPSPRKTPQPSQTIQPEVEQHLLKPRIVLDAGHGGEDPGAIGHRGLQEKDVTLILAKEVKKQLEKIMPQAEVFLTRDHDKTLSLSSRTAFANNRQADLFVSIHVNSAPNRHLQGVETYYLSTTHDRYAIRLAARENAMTETETSNLEFILADLAMKSSVTESMRLGHLVQNSLCMDLSKKWTVPDLGLKSAMFAVLMGAKMPAILVETAFISNKTDEKYLRQSKYRYTVAEGISKGIERYFEEKLALR